MRETSPNCTGLCEAGYYCREGSTSPRKDKCGNPSYYCPTGSKLPIPVAKGFYTVSDTKEPFDRKTQQIQCPKGKFVWPQHRGFIIVACLAYHVNTKHLL